VLAVCSHVARTARTFDSWARCQISLEQWVFIASKASRPSTSCISTLLAFFRTAFAEKDSDNFPWKSVSISHYFRYFSCYASGSIGFSRQLFSAPSALTVLSYSVLRLLILFNDSLFDHYYARHVHSGKPEGMVWRLSVRLSPSQKTSRRSKPAFN